MTSKPSAAAVASGTTLTAWQVNNFSQGTHCVGVVILSSFSFILQEPTFLTLAVRSSFRANARTCSRPSPGDFTHTIFTTGCVRAFPTDGLSTEQFLRSTGLVIFQVMEHINLVSCEINKRLMTTTMHTGSHPTIYVGLIALYTLLISSF